MAKQRLSKYYVLMVWTTAIINLIMSWYYASVIHWNEWFLLLKLLFFTIVLQAISTRLTRGINLTLATTIIFPVIYISGITPAIIIAGIIGLLDGILNKEHWMGILFNISQLPLCALLGFITFNWLGGREVSIMFQGLLAISLGIVVQMVMNIILVTLFSAISIGTSWRKEIRQFGMTKLTNVLEKALISLVFTLFVSSYEFWGFLACGVLLIHLSDLLGASVKLNHERMRRFELEEALLVDELTTAYNFRFLNNWLNESTREKTAVLFIDIDNFREYNELYGHQEGDKVLRMITKLIKECIRERDKVIRYGGDEFIVLLPKLDAKRALYVGERILNSLERATVDLAKEILTVSIGIGVAKKANVEKQKLINAADAAMYEAKKSGKNTLRLKEVAL